MNSDTENPSGAQFPDSRLEPGSSEKKLPESWKDALACLVSSRISIIQAESKDAAALGARKALFVAVAAFCALFTWILILAGAVGAISSATAWIWYHVAFAAAGLHLLIAVFALLAAKSKSAPSFPITRAEFEKDREWLNQLNKKPK
jgi:uncharacterized membrane protein YqjE